MNRTGFRLGCSLFLRKWWMQAIIVLLLAVTLLMVNVLIGIVYNAFGAIRLFRGFDDKENTAFFMPQDDDMTKGVWNELEHTVYEPVSFKFSDDQDGQKITLMLYGERTAAGLGIPTDGADGGAIPCVASAPYRVGDIIETWYYDRVATLQVVALLREGAPYLDFAVFSNSPTFDMLCDRVSAKERAVVLACREQMPRSIATRAQFSAVVFFDGDSTADKARLESAGWLVSLADVEKESKEEAESYIAIYLPVSLATCLIGIVSLVGLMLMLLLRQMRTLVIFQICGMSRWQLGCIGRAYGLLISLTAFALAAVGWFTIAPNLLETATLSWANVVITLLLLALPVVLAELLPRRMIPKEDPFTVLTTTEAMI